MKTKSILKEIRATRDKLAEEAGGDMRRLFAIVRERSKAIRPRGEVTIPEPKPCATVREEEVDHQAGWQRQWEPATNPILAEIRQTREALMAEAGGDLNRFFEMVREREAAAKARGVVFVPVPQPKEAAP
jgi:hypothetical protein